VEDALLLPCSGLPRTDLTWRIDGGVFDAAGAPVPEARPREPRMVELAPALPPRGGLPLKPGAFLFGGWLQRHFGHALLGLGRLWALPDLAGQVRAVLFLRLPDNAFHDPRQSPMQVAHVADLLGLLGVGSLARGRVLREPLRVARLAVPEQLALGAAGASAADNAAYLGMMRRMAAARDLPPGLGPRLYVSRRRLPETAGRVLFEDLLEENLARERFAILHPEQVGVREQVAAYAAARLAIFAESSAIHLALGVMDPAARLAVVARRRPMAASLRSELGAAGVTAEVIDVLRGAVMVLEGEAIAASSTFAALAVPDLAALRDRLVAAGFCQGQGWRLPTAEAVGQAVTAALAQRRRAHPGRQVVWVPPELLGRSGVVPGLSAPG
jgi:hypothetical protein